MALIPTTTEAKQTTQVKILMGSTLPELEANTNTFLDILNNDVSHNYQTSLGLTVEITGGFTLTLVYSYLTINASSLDL